MNLRRKNVKLLVADESLRRELPTSHTYNETTENGADSIHTFPFPPRVYSTPFQNTDHYYHIPLNRKARSLRGGGQQLGRDTEGMNS